MLLPSTFERYYEKVLSGKTQKKFERFILIIAITSFIIHLGIILLADMGMLSFDASSDLLKNPIAAVYTPFSFILVYEVYLLIYYLPKSITTYISKQYEIITLIIIRRLFKDLSDLSLSTDWFSIKYDLNFTYDLIASVLLFFLIYQFYIRSKSTQISNENSHTKTENITSFIQVKKILAACLVPLLVTVAVYSFIVWLSAVVFTDVNSGTSFKNINNIFFEQFFTILIVADVLLLLFSLFHTDEFHKIIRNSGFIISTILIRLSFAADGLLNTLLIISAVVFGLLLSLIHISEPTRPY